MLPRAHERKMTEMVGKGQGNR